MSTAIEDYALLSDLQTSALVGRDGSIDWLCLPTFSSPACFAALLDSEDAGRWWLGPVSRAPAGRRRYRRGTLILESEWDTDQGAVRLTDLMPVRGEASDVIRIVEGLSGEVTMAMDLRLRLDYGRVVPWVRVVDFGARAIAGPDALFLTSPVPLRAEHRSVTARFTVSAGQRVAFVLTHQASHLPRPAPVDTDKAALATEQFWTEWIGRCAYTGRWQAAVRRSLILLKALTYSPTGGILAAATTSLPEEPGGSRNWDYRYCWLRDSTFTLQALLGTGYVEEARAWREWLLRAIAGDPADLQPMYGLDGTRRIPECEADWLSGFQASRPVRIGNAAAGQFQLDVWGEVLGGLHLAREAGLSPEESAWDVQRALLDFLESNWAEPDSGLWEVRGSRRDFVHSKVMAWAGLDRAVRAVERYGLGGPVDQWRRTRTEIRRDVLTRGFDRDRNTFTQFYGSRGLDAALLLLPRVGFLPWTDPRMVGTLDAVQHELCHEGLLLRYRPDHDQVDGLPGTENAFVACSFWLVDALHGVGRRAEAEGLFERLLELRNDIGLLSEQYDPRAGRQLGNTPQAFSLVGLINSARLLGGADTGTLDVA